MKQSFLPALALFAVMAAFGPLHADTTPPTPPPAPPSAEQIEKHIERKLHFLTEKLGLTADQQTQIKAILESTARKLSDLHQDESLTPEDKKTDFMAIFEEEKTQIEAVLTPAQKTTFESLPREEGHHVCGLDGMLEHLTKMLNLTADQQAQIKTILEAQKQKLEALHQSGGDPASKKAQFQAIWESTKSQIDAILTPEQKAKLESLHKGHSEHSAPQQAPPLG